MMNVYETIRAKRAIRQFENRPLPDDVARQILNAGRLSQSSKNTQPWQFIAIRDRETLVALSKLGTWAGHLAGAAMGVTILTPNPDEKFQTLFDAGQAAAYMQLAAWELGVGSCLASIYQPDDARKLLGFPAEYTLHIAISFGYPAPEAVAPRPPRPEGRKPFDEVVHWDKWGG
jgi:nitroreductase